MKSLGKTLVWTALPLLLLTPLLLWQGHRFSRQLAEAERRRTENSLQLHAGVVQKALNRIEGNLDSLAVYVAGQSPDGSKFDTAQFDTFAAGLHASSKWIRAFQIVSNGVIVHAYPVKGNEGVLDYNLLTAPPSFRGSDVTRALQRGRITVTGPLTLIQGGLGIIMRKPVLATNGGTPRLVGIVLNIDPLLAESGIGPEGVNDIRLAIRGPSGEVFGSPAVFKESPATHRISLSDGSWEMGGCPLQGWQAARSLPVLLFYGGGSTVIFLLCALFFSLARSQANLTETVQEKTKELRNELIARHEVQEQFRLIMENLADMVAVLDLNGHRLYHSPSYGSILGDPTGLLGTSAFEQVHPEDRVHVRQAFEDTVRTGVGHRLRYRMLDRRGLARHIEAQGSVIRDESGRISKVILVSRDVTERQMAEQALRHSEQKYRDLVQHANSIILRWNSSGQIMFLNEFGLSFFGYSAEEIFGRHVVGTIVPQTESSGRDLGQQMSKLLEDPIAFEQNVNENMRRNGERVWIAWTNRIVRDAYGTVVEILSVGTDITARRQAEREIQCLHDDLKRYAVELEQRVSERTAELVQARDRAQIADQTKSAFLATMSHELRTPLNSIIGFTGILRQGLAGPLNAEQNKQLDMVRTSARHLLALINDVLDISKIEAGQIEIAPAPFNLREAIEKVVQSVTPLAAKKNLALVQYISPDVGPITSDRRRVEQILLNLFSNAIKFSERGTVTLRAEALSGVIHVSVADTGIGIKPEDLGKLFQPFRQLDTGLTRQHDGTGLGLAICKRLAERLGGAISVTSQWGAGSTFEFTLPEGLERNHE